MSVTNVNPTIRHPMTIPPYKSSGYVFIFINPYRIAFKERLGLVGFFLQCHDVAEVAPRRSRLVLFYRASRHMKRCRSNGGVLKSIIPCDRNIICIAIDICQIVAILESTAINMCNAIRYSQSREIATALKGICANPFHTIWDRISFLLSPCRITI